MPRQVGKTTTTAGFILWRVLFNEHYSVAILANKDKKAREILDRIQKMFENLPQWMQQGVTEWNKGNIELENGSKIVATSTSSSAARGDTYSCVYLDEFAHVERNIQEEFFASVYPTISSGETTQLVMTSTPKGMELFYKIWVESEEGRNSYKRVEVHWSQVPGRDQKWKEETIANTSEDLFRQEHECVDGKTQITVRNKKTGKTKKLTINKFINMIVNSLENNNAL
jgi:phage terminase large subunit GpA-like protein